MKERLMDVWKRHWMLLVGAAAFWALGLYMGGGSSSAPHKHAHTHSKAQSSTSAVRKKTIWSCSMHPQIRMPKQGKCPICFMDLTPVTESNDQSDPRQLSLSPAGKALAEIRTHRVERRPVVHKVRLIGRIVLDETRVKSITARVSGRLERMFVDYTGVSVRRGDHLVRIYSPALLAAQQEVIQTHRVFRSARRRKHNTFMLRSARLAYQAARRKLELLGVRSWQIQKLLRKKKPSDRINMYAPMGGIVLRKHAMEGTYVQTGSPIYTLADLSHVWIRLDAYERDLPWLYAGQKVTFTTQATAGVRYTGKVVYIDPVLDPKTRTVGVRVNVRNPKGRLKPGMFVRAHIHALVGAKGRAQIPQREGRWICPMHPEIVRKKRTRCPLCGMRLKRIVGPSKEPQHDPLVIPTTAPLLTGKRALVYIEKEGTKRPTYVGREVLLGPRTGDFYVVLSGLKEGDRVVSHGAFRLDSELQLQARPSMMSASSETSVTDHTLGRAFTGPYWRTSRTVRQHLSVLFTLYFKLRKMLAKDRPQKAQKLYAEIFRFAQKRKRLRQPHQVRWEKIRVRLFALAQKGSRAQTLKLQRMFFEGLSALVIFADDRWGHAGMKPHYVAYCPMAFNNRGAYWLQQSKQIDNAYFGAKMLRCGEIKRSILGRLARPVKLKRSFLRRLDAIYTPYLELQEALFKDDFKKAMSATQTLARIVKQARWSLWIRRRQSGAKVWRKLLSELRTNSRNAVQSNDIQSLRKRFEFLSHTALHLARIFGHSRSQPLYEAYCPMAFNNRGAAWLQAQNKRIHNAYFGAKMAFCGTFRATFPTRTH